jgi:methionyl-tRNA synthetase
LKPILPDYADKVAALLNEKPYVWADTAKTLLGTKIGEYQHLATRIETVKVDAMIEATKKENEKVGETRKSPAAATTTQNPKGKSMTEPAAPKGESNFLDIETFNKVDLRIGKIVKAEAIPEADKLLKLQIDLGPLGVRQVFAGIKSAYDPATLEGRLTVVVANLAPRKMKFGMSEGMVLAASDPTDGASKGLFILSPDAGAKPGDRVK